MLLYYSTVSSLQVSQLPLLGSALLFIVLFIIVLVALCDHIMTKGGSGICSWVWHLIEASDKEVLRETT